MLLQVKNLRCGYGSLEVVRGVSLHVSAGEIVGLLGANGAGKSSLLRAIIGLLTPWEGDIFITGCDHKTNSALYRLSQKDQELHYVGDARTASEAAENWMPGETAEKFHVRPIFLRGRLYLATADFTGSDDG